MATVQRTTRELTPYPDLSVALVEAGAGSRTVLVVHGGAGPRSVGTIIDHFAPTSRVIAPTHPGWNETPRPDWFTGVDSLAVTYLDLLDDEDLRDVVVIGCSIGGWVASEMAVRDRGHRIGSLVVIDGIGPEIPGYQVAVPQQRNGVGPSPQDMATTVAYAGPSMSDPKLLRRLGRVRIPTLVLWGEDDVVVPPGFGKSYADAFADARFATIPGAGHMPTLQDPDTAFAIVDGFLAAS